MNRVAKNASWIIVCRVIQALLSFVVTLLTARYLGPSNYGLINYAASLVAFVTPFVNLGLTSILVQEVVNDPENEGEIVGTSLLFNFGSSFLCIVGIIAFSVVANPGEIDTIIVCSLYSAVLVFHAIANVQYWFQAKLLSKYVSLTSVAAYAVVSAYKIYLLVTGKSIYWFAVSNAIDYLVIAITLVYFYHKIGGKKFVFSRERGKALLSKGKFYIISDLMVVVFAQTDKLMIKSMLGSTDVGYYSAAVACAGMTSFIFGAIIDSARPAIFGSVKISKEAFKNNMSRLYSIITYFSLIQSVCITLFSGLIISILYGNEYATAINTLRIVVWYTTFAYYGSVRNVWLLAEGKQKYLWQINLAGAVANVVLNYFLIQILGINGAAIASLVTQLFTNVLTGLIMPPLRENNALMMSGLNPKHLVHVIKRSFNKK